MNSPEGRAVLGRGFDPTKQYDTGDIDTINLFNGSLSLRIPIGPSYPQHGGASFSLTLAYSSNVWDFKSWPEDLINWYDDVPPTTCETYTQKWPTWTHNAGLGWRLTLGELYEPGRIDLPQAEQAVDGVTLNEGQTAMWRYDAPDGSSHEFLTALHLEAGGGPLYTNDGSYLRLKPWTPPQGGPGRVIEMPDGRRHYFELAPNAFHPGAPGRTYRVRWMDDAFGNRITVAYANSGKVWTITDQHGREIIVKFGTAQEVDAAGAFGGRFLKEVVMPAASGPNESPRTVTYQFGYETRDGGRNCRENYPWGQTFHRPPEPAPGPLYQMRLALLAKITRVGDPDWRYELSYEPPATGDTCADDHLLAAADLPTRGRTEWSWSLWEMGSAQECPPQPGPGGQGEPCGAARVHPATFNPGVKERRSYNGPFDLPYPPGPGDPEPEGLLGKWTYQQELNMSAPADCDDPEEDQTHAKTTVVDPLGHKTVHYFSIFTHSDLNSVPSTQGWTRAEYGLPFRRDVSQVLNDKEVFLSTETFHCDNPGTPGQLCDGGGETCKPLQKTYVRYAHDAQLSPETATGCNEPDRPGPPLNGVCRALNPRLEARMTDFYNLASNNTSPVRFAGVEHSNYDGVGHYRHSETFGDFCNVGGDRANFCRGDERSSVTGYNPDLGTLEAGGNWSPPSPADRWLFSLYDFQQVEESDFDDLGGLVQKTSYDFDESTGFLLSRRVHVANRVEGGDIPSKPQDLLIEYVPEVDPAGNQTGNVAVERHSGGDRFPIHQGAQFELRHQYDAGVLACSHVAEPSAGTLHCTDAVSPHSQRALRLVYNEIDSATGLVTKSEDATGLGVEYEYDDFSRLVKVLPDHETETNISYQTATESTAANVTIERGSGEGRTERKVDYDGFGRVRADYSLLPDGGSSNKVVKEYFAGGLVHRESTRGPGGAQQNPKGWTTTTCYDPLGRPLEVLYPDHGHQNPSQHRRTRYEWNGPHLRNVTTANAARARSGGTALVDDLRIERYDGLGRLWGVLESSAGPGAAGRRETLYRLDLQDRLVRVRSYATADPAGGAPSCAGGCQTRDFTYDGLGFLRGESHPELTGSTVLGGQLDVLHDLYDVRGNPGRRRDGRTELRYDYDFAGRPIRTSDADGQPIVELFYAEKNRGSGTSTNRTAGRLIQAKRHHYIGRLPGSFGDWVAVTETYGYEGVGGRLSDYSVRSFSPHSEEPGGYPSLRFTSHIDYDTFGRISRITHPHCSVEDTEHCPATDPSRVVENVFTHGWLTEVGQTNGLPFASEITYHPNGLPHVIVHGAAGGVQTVQAQDERGIARPKSISTTGIVPPSDNWQSGTFSYDSLGNIYGIGPDEYLYDDVNRVVEARIASAHPNPLRIQQYDYDVYGNLLSITDAGEDPLDLPVEPATNRLKPPVEYDVSGNVTKAGFLNLSRAEWDPLGSLRAVFGTGLNRQFLYTAAGERLAVFDNMRCGAGCIEETWTLRGPGSKVLREYTHTLESGNPPEWSRKDYVYRGGSLLAAVEGGDTRFFHLDHLGSPRLISDRNKVRKDYHVYFPFGREATPRLQNRERMKFTGHERDLQTEGIGSLFGEADDLDYMHARYYSPWVGRFLSVDPVLGEAGDPQSWNRMAYARGNPVKFLDPDGAAIRLGTGGDVAYMRDHLVQLVRRPQTRQMLQELSSSQTAFTFQTETLSGKFGRARPDSQMDYTYGPANRRGRNKRVGVGTHKDFSQVTISLDSDKISRHHPFDKSGLGTAAHETLHAWEINRFVDIGQHEMFQEFLDSADGVNPEIGSTAKQTDAFAQWIIGTDPDITYEAAESILDDLLKNP